MTPGIHPLLLLAAALLGPLAGCDSDTPDGTVLYGDAVTIGDGTARTYVALSDETPTAVGVLLSTDALSGLPTAPGGAGHEMDDMHVLPMPAGARAAGVVTEHVSLDWNPHGHEPTGLFTLPHFDVHFYTVSAAERMTWVPTSPDFANGARQPTAAYMPAGYVADPSGAVIPTMGLHWLDSADPTYAPGGPGFTEVVLWGSYDGEVVFVEPMITKATFEALRASGDVHTETLAQPASVAKAGYYPTTYSVRYDAEAGAYRIELGGLAHRAAS